MAAAMLAKDFMSVQRPQRKRGDVLHEYAIARNYRRRPGGAVGHGVRLQRFETAGGAARHNQLAIVFQDEQEVGGSDNRRVASLARRRSPQRRPGFRVRPEELPAVE